jgi:hypothetical protein
MHVIARLWLKNLIKLTCDERNKTVKVADIRLLLAAGEIIFLCSYSYKELYFEKFK